MNLSITYSPFMEHYNVLVEKDLAKYYAVSSLAYLLQLIAFVAFVGLTVYGIIKTISYINTKILEYAFMIKDTNEKITRLEKQYLNLNSSDTEISERAKNRFSGK